MLRLWIYSNCKCCLMKWHDRQTTPFRVLNPEKAIIVLCHTQLKCVWVLVFSCLQTNYIWRLLALHTGELQQRDAWIIRLITRAKPTLIFKAHLSILPLLESDKETANIIWAPCLFVYENVCLCGFRCVCHFLPHPPVIFGEFAERERGRERTALICWRWLKEIWEITCVS